MYLPQRLLLNVDQQVVERFVVGGETAPHVAEVLGHGDDVRGETSGRLPGRSIPLIASCHD